MVKGVVILEASQMFLIFARTKDFIIEVKEKNECYLVGAKNQFLGPPPFGDCCHSTEPLR